MKNRFTFPKEQRLKKQLLIDELFLKGKVFHVPFMRVHFLESDFKDDVSVKLLVSVSARNFKRSVDRNRIKRLMREAYRLNKNELMAGLKQKEKKLLLGIIYTGKTICTYRETEERIVLLLNRLKKEFEIDL